MTAANGGQWSPLPTQNQQQSPFSSTPRTVYPSSTQATPRPMVSRNTSMFTLPSPSPQAHAQALQRAHSLQSPQSPGWGPGLSQAQSPVQQQGMLTPLLPQHQQQIPVTVGGGTAASADYRFSPRRKRLSMTDAPNTPRRIRRRLFFADRSDEPEAPEDMERHKAVQQEAVDSALTIIREAVEVGDAHIDLSDLQLEQVPDELAELKDLVVLAPSHTMVTALQLTLGANRLKHFPLAVCELTNLTTLILSHNRIAYLPPEIGALANLRELSVAHNCLRVLPLELTRLTQLQTLSAFPNPFATPPHADATHQPIETVLRRHLLPTKHNLWPFAVDAPDMGVPRLADLAARQLSRDDLIALKYRLAQCLDTTARPALGRIVGPAIEHTAGSGVLSALRAHHLVVPVGHECTHCHRWILVPVVEVILWAPLSLLSRPAPFKAQLCCRNCLYSDRFAEILTKPT
ncbi:hypothetical protein IW140_001198 [Coemansia sp. RSA 1813]|nr:hypothetical protein EV178_001211 [Coemansia sp. RSA 1646]KAJ1772132.1 hypothetical protein LPJ74_001717 [Coemansia sp. RSA 1843]KAJ2091749.1 hypothetical protein IW138_001732 [Coemansia sp. RSA 986]KAJ2216847.1 hypothetical protein EV179_000881 [Coemansia sp. RSA 487]KAJ2571849.1 hypothetical protein IW140_001198 [Coemansia sp. RSA 1813]